MPRLLPSPAPSAHQPSTPLIFEKSPKGQLLRIEVNVLITILLLVALLFFGIRRRYVRVGYIMKCVTRIIYMLIPVAIAYIMGLMHSASTIHRLYPMWACALIYAYGGVITMTACDFSDIDDTLSYLLRTVPLLFWTTWLASVVFAKEKQISVKISLGVVLLGFLVVSIANTMETIQAFYLACKSKGLRGLVEPTVLHMRRFRGVDVHDQVDTMIGYNYVVWRYPGRGDENGAITTTEEIWGSVNQGFLANYEGVDHLKDLCLSYAFFRLILRRFAGCPLYEIDEPTKTRTFMRQMLLPEHSEERVFRLIEVELHFLFDFFYTKSHVCMAYEWSDLWKLIKGAFLLGILFFADTVGLSSLSPAADRHEATMSFSISFRGHNMDTGVTRIVLLILFLLEICKSVMLLFSNWPIVWLLCTFRGHWLAWIVENWITLIWNIREYMRSTRGCVSLFKPWQRKLGQYSFLESHGQVPWLARERFPPLAKYVPLQRVGQTGDFSVPLSSQVRTAIVKSLHQHLQRLLAPLPEGPAIVMYPGRATLGRYGLVSQFENECPLLPEAPNVCELRNTKAHVILVWHIATCYCEAHRPPRDADSDDYRHFLVATQLSKYCAYLLTFAPELLPDLPYTTERVSDIAHKQMVPDIEDLMSLHQQNGLLGEDGLEEDGNPVIILKGAKLAAKLFTEVFDVRQEPWQVLAEFWAELLLYLAPSDNVTVHGEYLARGGEFITHVWALLTHAGIVARN